METFEHLTSARLSRRTLLKGAGAAGLGVALAGALPIGEAAAQENLQDILNITTTVEHFGVTFLGVGIDNARKGQMTPPIPDPVIAILEAARAQEQFHIDFFKSLGGVPLTTTFNLPDPKLVTDSRAFFDALVQQETREVAAQIAAFKTFVALGRPDLLKVSFQYAAEEAEHRLLANYALGTRPANNYAFYPNRYNTTADLVAELRQLGIVGGTGPAATYPGPGQINPAGVIERTPGGPVVTCTAPGGMPGLPNTGGGGAQGGPGLGEAATFMGLLGLGAAALTALARQIKAREEEEAGG